MLTIGDARSGSIDSNIMPRHKQPIDQSPSRTLTHFGEELVRTAQGPILDVACGYGRNAIYVASFGVEVVCIDHDSDALDHIECLAKAHPLIPMRLDLLSDPWPFKRNSIGAIVNVHHYHPTLLDRFIESIGQGGCLYLETIGGQGCNYLELPPRGFILDQLRDQFDIAHYKENPVRSDVHDAASVKLFATKRPRDTMEATSGCSRSNSPRE
ncbi:MAG TPA: class I SAM-dependent methyltransferase [Gaiellaceae bacterium]|jgi:SAM-dependent methyltransferase|nr:class I SAM-dependent methyltransferase [Gaiellaceae bacterium]